MHQLLAFVEIAAVKQYSRHKVLRTHLFLPLSDSRIPANSEEQKLSRHRSSGTGIALLQLNLFYILPKPMDIAHESGNKRSRFLCFQFNTLFGYALISILRLLSVSLTGSSRVRTPSLKRASTIFSSTFSGNRKDLEKDPCLDSLK